MMSEKAKNIDETDRLDTELLLLNFFDPNEFENNRKVLQKNYYENKWKR